MRYGGCGGGAFQSTDEGHPERALTLKYGEKVIPYKNLIGISFLYGLEGFEYGISDLYRIKSLYRIDIVCEPRSTGALPVPEKSEECAAQ